MDCRSWTKEQTFGILMVVGSYLLEFSFGYSNTIGNLNTHLIRHMGVTTSQSIWFLGATLVVKSIFTPLGELISHWVPYICLLFATVIICSGSIFLNMWSINNGMIAFLFTNSVLFEIGIGLSLTATLQRAVAQFPQHNETILGLVGSAFGFGTILFVPVQAIAAEVEHLPDHPDSKKAFSQVFLITGVVILVIQSTALTFSFIAFWFTRGEHPQVAALDLRSIRQNMREIAKRPETHIISCINFLNVIPKMAIVSTFKVYGKAVGFDVDFLVTVATLNGIFNCVGYVTARVACSKASFKAPLICFQMLFTSLIILFPLVDWFGLKSFALYVFCVFGAHFAMAAVTVVTAVASNAIIAPLTNFGTNLALCLSTAASAVIFSATISTQNVDVRYDIFYWSLAGVGVIEIMLALTLKDTACPLKCMRGRFFAPIHQETRGSECLPETERERNAS